MGRVVSTGLLAVWLVFISVEFLEHAGLFLYSDQEVDRAVDEALVNLGEAFKASRHEQIKDLTPSPLPVVTFVSVERAPVLRPCFTSLKADVFKRAFPIYMLHGHFRI